MSKYIDVDLRKRLLCIGSLDEYIGEYVGGFAVGRTDEEICDFLCREAISANSVRQRTHLNRLARHYSCAEFENVHYSLSGVVIEFGMGAGVDALGVYLDGNAAWYDATTRKLLDVTFSENQKNLFDKLFSAAQTASRIARVVPGEVPGPPEVGSILISFIVTDGIAYCGGPARNVASDGVAGPIVNYALEVRKLILSV